jgi:hypothetical protein
MQPTIEQLIAIITITLAVATAAAGGIAWLWNRPQARAGANKTLSETVDMLSKRLSQLETEREADHGRILNLEAENRSHAERSRVLERLLSICVVGLQALANQLARENIEPEWLPPAELDRWMVEYLKDNSHV